jgi:hypothetical protein
VCTTAGGSQRRVLSYQRLQEVLEPLPVEERSFVYLFLDSNDRKTRVKLGELENERRELEEARLLLAKKENHVKTLVTALQGQLGRVLETYRKNLNRGEANPKLEANLLSLLAQVERTLFRFNSGEKIREPLH